ncbi:MAG: HK97 gp10 family phage protein [Bacillota bacterium]
MRSDFSQLKRWQQNLEKECKAIDLLLEELTRDAVGLFLKEVIDKTPVQTGELQSGWLGGGLSSSVAGFVSGLSLKKEGNTYKIEVSNDTSYASHVEYGHLLPSGEGFVNGQFFMTNVAETVEQQISDLMEKQLALKFAKVLK